MDGIVSLLCNYYCSHDAITTMKLIFDSQNRLLIEIHDIIKYNVPLIHYYTLLTNRYVDIRIMINQLVKNHLYLPRSSQRKNDCVSKKWHKDRSR